MSTQDEEVRVAAWSVIDLRLYGQGIKDEQDKAQALGISYKTYKRYLDGETEPGFAQMRRFAAKVGLSMKELAELTEQRLGARAT